VLWSIGDDDVLPSLEADDDAVLSATGHLWQLEQARQPLICIPARIVAFLVGLDFGELGVNMRRS